MVSDPDEAFERAVLTIDLRALVANWRTLAARAAPAGCAAVVKANAYGTGLEHSARALAGAGCRTFFVAHVGEAVSLRRTVGPAIEIFVLNGFTPGAENLYRAHRLNPVLGSLPEVARWSALAGPAGDGASSAALHVDTGMNRLGLSFGEAKALLCSATPLPFPITLLMSHLVSAEIERDPYNARQLAAFQDLRKLLPGTPASLANSSGVFLGPAYAFDLVRPGYALYGGNPTPSGTNPMRPVVSLVAPVILCRTLEAGESVGYNGQWRAKRRTRLATIAVGYADGYPRNASASDAHPGGCALIEGVRCPFAGRVSMDLIVLDATGVHDTALQPGTAVELIGTTITVDEVGARAATSGYEILTNLGNRYRRVSVA